MLLYFHLETLLPRLCAFLVAMALHDAAHLGAAWLLGNRAFKRGMAAAFNPLARLDAIGLAMTLFGPYGWSKPLPIEASQFPRWPRLANTLVYAAGPLMNLLLGIIFWWLNFTLPETFGARMETLDVEMWRIYLQYAVIVNVMLGLIHFLPLYPLDGWAIWKGFLTPGKQRKLARYERHALMLVLFLMITPVGQWLLSHGYPYIAQFIMYLYSL
ncbi:M50 family metallopeptidase [Paenibacillus oryzisoli]|uniref:M50 family metallopeptidase n=1 Tax=Paenibacillus oryzisoli TaxID=1850517 RepID=UPI003D2B4A5C